MANAPINLSMNNFLSKLNALGSVAKSCRFAVRIVLNGELVRRLPLSSQLEDMTYVCDAVEFPGRGFGVTNVRYYGAGQVMPNNTEYGPANISLICTENSFQRQFFDDWQYLINPTTNFNFYYPKQYYCDIEIYQFSEYAQGAGTFRRGETTFTQAAMAKTPKVLYQWKLYDCWPTFVNPQQVTWADNSDVLRLQVTMAYRYWDRPDKRLDISGITPPAQSNPAAALLTQVVSK